MENTCQNEYGALQSVFIKHAKDAFLNEDHIAQHWENLNYLQKPDFAASLQEYDNFKRIIQEQGATLHLLPQDSSVNMDSIYCRDAAIATNKGMIICNMGKAGRAQEPLAERRAFEAAGIPVLAAIQSPGTLEGGDTAWLDETTLAVGHTYRTNASGIEQLRSILQPLGVTVVVASLPHYKGPSDVFHLMSILSPVDKDLAVVYSPLMPISFRNLLLNRGYQLVEVPEEEFESMGCNVLALAPRKCLMVAGNPLTKKALENAGCTMLAYNGADISVKGGGGPTCLTRPLWRSR